MSGRDEKCRYPQVGGAGPFIAALLLCPPAARADLSPSATVTRKGTSQRGRAVLHERLCA
jgi:hypothetical protein